MTVKGTRLACTVRGSFGPLLAAIADQEVLTMTSQEPSLEELFLAYYRKDAVGPDQPAAPP